MINFLIIVSISDRMFEKSASLGCPEGQFNLAMMQMQGRFKNTRSAVKLLKKAADRGNVAAQINLGLVYDHGREVPVNPGEAFKYYSLAVKQGSARAMNLLGELYIVGKGIKNKADPTQAYRLFQDAAGKGDAMAQFNLGLMHEHGTGGVPMDKIKAAEFYELAVLAGNAKAQNNLAALHQYGVGGVPIDMAKAVRLFMQSADQGNAFAQTNLALIYLTGVPGILGLAGPEPQNC